MKTFEEVLVTLKNLTFAKLLLNFSSKSPWCSPLLLKFESYNPHHCKNNCHKFFFLVFTEQLLYQIILGRLHCYEVTLIKKWNKPLLQKRFIKNLSKVSEKNDLALSRINQIMSIVLILSERLPFWTCRAFSHFTFHILEITWGILL